ncbi:3-dehydroquinate synthase [Flavobacterium sp.]|uniref:3-dehydroquinate synthase n=1 Tax=Flavobacterium sp. TaxID=239 RepID=UPI00262DC8C9|nr:3-dehydroquinate synthase [Flavobacterium sp.]
MQAIMANGYPIEFNEAGYSALNQYITQKKYSTVFVLTDTHSHEYCAPHFLSLLETTAPVEIIEIEPGESMKTIQTCMELWTLLTEMGADRKSLLINLGGGVITDLGGFVAATFKRGIDFIHVPTTLLGMVDAAIGGKNGVDLGLLKNQVGVIHNPKLLLIDSTYLQTLPARQMRSGLAEMFKHGLIHDALYWAQLSHLSNLDLTDLDALIHRSVAIKNEIVSQDPTENGIRKALNFGHTLGHAIESHYLNSDTPLLHGEAIALGMLMEAFISHQKGYLSAVDLLGIKTTLQPIFDPFPITEEDQHYIREYLIHDKKNEYGQIQFALLEGIGKTKLHETVENELITAAFDFLNN